MKFKDDILQRIRLDFKDSADIVIGTFTDAIAENDCLKTDRVIRCIIFLANGDIDSLNKFIDHAIFDSRDVMLWAEYEKSDTFNFKRIRDFNHTFDKCTENVKE